MKKTYETPSIEVVKFQYRDQVVVASTPGANCEQQWVGLEAPGGNCEIDVIIRAHSGIA